MTIPIFDALMEGKVYKRAMPRLQTNIFLRCILRDYGKDALKLALKSVKGHVDYFHNKFNSKLKVTREVYEKYSLI